MKTRFLIIIGIIIVLSSSSLFFYFMDSEGIVYPGTGSIMHDIQSKLCEKLSGNTTKFGNCFGINDICEEVHGILQYDESRLEVGCNLHNRIDINCTNLELATGWEKYSSSICYMPLKTIP